LLATIEQGSQADPAKIKYITADHLGSVRIVVKGDGSVLSRHDYKPFGEMIPSTGTGSGQRQQITEYGGVDGERDGWKQRSTEQNEKSGMPSHREASSHKSDEYDGRCAYTLRHEAAGAR